MDRRSVIHGIKTTTPIAVSYFILALGSGILFQSKGISWGWATAISLFVYSGSLQFLAPVLFASQATLISTMILSFIVNIRLLFYGISQLNRYTMKGWKKLYLIHGLTDETFSVVSTDKLVEGYDRDSYYLAVTFTNQVAWVVGCLLGCLMGELLPFSMEGVEFSLTSLFLVIVVNQWESTDNHKPAILGFAISMLCILLFGMDTFMLPTMLIIAAILLIENKLKAGRPDYV